MGGDHDITMRLEIPRSWYIGLYAEFDGRQDWRSSGFDQRRRTLYT
jgi:hypothetical protein